MHYVVLVSIGVLMGLFGGLLGVGGSIVMIPALVFAFGENEHLYQASAMICNFFVAITSALVHKKADVLVADVVKLLIPSAAAAAVVGVAISNSALFAGKNSYLLARIYGGFLLYVIVYNVPKFTTTRGGTAGLDISQIKRSIPLTVLCGFMTGVPAGLLGIGGGIICVPAQQFLLKMPLKRAIANSAATIAALSIVGAFYKNITLAQHGIAVSDSLKIAAVIIPGAIAGAFAGGRIMHKLPVNAVRAVFILLAAAACYKMLTVVPGH